MHLALWITNATLKLCLPWTSLSLLFLFSLLKTCLRPCSSGKREWKVTCVAEKYACPWQLDGPFLCPEKKKFAPKKLFYCLLIQCSSYSGTFFSLMCIHLAGKPTGWRRDKTLQTNKELFGLPGYSRLWSIWGQSNYYFLFSYSCRWLSFSLGSLAILIFTPVTNLLLPVWIISTTYKFSLNVKGPSSLLRCIKCYELLT